MQAEEYFVRTMGSPLLALKMAMQTSSSKMQALAALHAARDVQVCKKIEYKKEIRRCYEIYISNRARSRFLSLARARCLSHERCLSI